MREFTTPFIGPGYREDTAVASIRGIPSSGIAAAPMMT